MASYPQGINIDEVQVSGSTGIQGTISGGPSITPECDVGNAVDNSGVPNPVVQDSNATQTRSLQTSQRVVDDVNNVRTARNMSRLTRRNEGVEGVSDDEELMTTDEILMVAPGGEERPNLPNNERGLQAANTAVTGKGAQVVDDDKWAYSEEVVAKNTQQSISRTIPAQLLAMVKHRVYVPLSFYLVESMERIRLERELKSYKSLTKPIRIIDDSNFINERELNFTQFTEAYHNFLRCMELSTKPGSTLAMAWEDHFTRATQDPQMKMDFKVFLHMDIAMRQQLVDNPFSPVIGSEQYRAGFATPHQEVNDARVKELVDSVKAELAVARMQPNSNKDSRYHPYSATYGNGAGSSRPGNSFPMRYNEVESSNSFRGKNTRDAKPRICLKCGATDSHISLQCNATTLYRHADRKTNISVKDKRLVYDADSQPVCFRFNLHNACSSDHARHPPHRCTLCLAPFHGAAHCTRL